MIYHDEYIRKIKEVYRMGTASHYVFMDLEEMIKNEKYMKLKEISEKYCERYTEDEDLKRICCNIIELLKSKNYDGLEAIRNDLKRLISSRKLQTSGGTKLWFDSRR